MGGRAMSVEYRAVLWNRQKKIYDAILAGGVVLYLGLFVGVGAVVHPNATAETLLIRGMGTCAFLLLHVILAIGPLARLDSRFLPLLYNRRHLGVTMFLLALAHGAFTLVQFHALGNASPLVSLFTSNTRFGSVAQFPFEILGFLALLILLPMAATSHDFWLHVLTPRRWKRIHMAVYAAYALLVGHVALGALQSKRSAWNAGLLIAGAMVVCTLHLAAGLRERRKDAAVAASHSNLEFVDVCGVEDIPEKRAFVATVGTERVAVFRYDGKVSAISNVCRHQNGPLGEGKIVNGCVTCPWHGYQYSPDCGASPPPFTDKVETFDVRVHGGRVLVNPVAHAPGTRVEPARIAVQKERA
jgi:nitrite reductase/ring-hydroxylating ferredoxin subunit/DMSO/TMAO reductase YedYZ heme-binding membrane subunit